MKLFSMINGKRLKSSHWILWNNKINDIFCQNIDLRLAQFVTLKKSQPIDLPNRGKYRGENIRKKFQRGGSFAI